ncbi:aspartate kinase [Actinosynnema sp. ALI-1.44]|nr:aspartate kinase [Actinosynnema sp. ALI-1.44]
MRKYGGSSLARPELVRGVAEDVAALSRRGKRVVVVVSAMGDTTDHLVMLAEQYSARPSPRELDQLMATGEQVSAAVLALALLELGVDAVSLSGDQAGIVVAGPPGAGVIVRIDPSRITELLHDGKVVVIAGFQGRDANGELRTLGRGGSDTTAVALAAALASHECEICTDVHGVHTADPRLVPDTQPVPAVSYQAMAELAYYGARVLHPRSVLLAESRRVPVRVLHSSRPGPATSLGDVEPVERGHEVVGIAHETGIRLVRLTDCVLPPGAPLCALTGLVGHGLRLDMLTSSDPGELWFTVRGAAPLDDLLPAVARELDAQWTVEGDLGAVSVIGAALLDDPMCLTELLRVVGGLGVSVPMIATSPSRLTAVVPEDHLDEAVRALHDAYGLGVLAGARP